MKKIYSFVFAAIAILSAASCQKEIVAPEADTNATAFSFVAEREAETKTTLVNGNSTWWTPGDLVSAFDSEGKAVTFATAIKENSASALFACESFLLPETGTIHAIYPDRGGIATLKDGVINDLHIAGNQKAVAGSFDPAYAVAYAKGQVENLNTPPALQFNNIHTLVKFTIGGEVAPQTVSLKSFAMRMCTGLFYYNTVTGETACTEGGHEVNLEAPAEGFKVGETYYIALVPGATKELTLYFDGEPAFTAGVDVDVTLAANKIYNLGTVAKPAAAENKLTKVWSTEVPFGSGQSRNMTMDSEYVYVAQAAGGDGVIKAISISDPTQVKDVKVKTHAPSGLTNGTHAISCVRMMPNNDSSVNGGKDVLIASNLTTGDGTAKLIVYIWKDGIDAEPDYWCISSGKRRLGDKFTVKGTYQKGELWFWDYGRTDDAAIRVNFANGEVGLWGSKEDNYATGRYSIPVNPKSEGANSIGEVIAHPGATFDGDGNPTALLATTNIGAGFVNQKAGNAYEISAWGTDPDLTQAWGFDFFTLKGTNYIAYTQIPKARNNAILNIIKDVNGAADFQGTLEAKEGLVQAALLGTAAAEGTVGHGVGDCAVVKVDDSTFHIAVMGQNLGIALYKFEAL